MELTINIELSDTPTASTHSNDQHVETFQISLYHDVNLTLNKYANAQTQQLERLEWYFLDGETSSGLTKEEALNRLSKDSLPKFTVRYNGLMARYAQKATSEQTNKEPNGTP
jgi:hypothetical protein